MIDAKSLQNTIAIQLAKSYEYAGYLDSARNKINVVIADEPLNIGLYQIKGNIVAASGLYYQSLTYYNLAYANNWNDAGIIYNRAGSYYRTRNFLAEKQSLDTLLKKFPTTTETKKMQKEWKEFNMTEVRTSFNYSRTFGPVQNGNGYEYALELYSKPINYNWRVFAMHTNSWTDIPEGQIQYTKTALGIEFRKNKWEVLAAMNHNNFGNTLIGASLKTIFTPDDYQTIIINAEKLSAETPLRGFYYNTYADRLGFTYRYRWNEKILASTAIDYLPFTDGNRRISFNASLQSLLYNQPHFKISSNAGIYSSANSQNKSSTAIYYFNPENDFSSNLGLKAEHTLKRQYEFAFTHALSLNATYYQQKNYDGKINGTIKYEQHIQLNYTKELSWSIANGKRLYDGIREPFLFFEISFYGKF